MSFSLSEVQRYFTQRTPQYESSSSWVRDKTLMRLIGDMLSLQAGERVLDVAFGSGQLGKVLVSTGAQLTGIDYTPAMIAGDNETYETRVVGDAHAMAFEDNAFGAVVCRQGIQFMDAAVAVREMARVVRPGGRVLLAHLTAYGAADREETFEIQRLRNPVRVNFFLPQDQPQYLREARLEVTRIEHYWTVESARNWLSKGAIPESRKEQALAIYRGASKGFRRKHDLRERDGDFLDRMLFVLALGEKVP